jgi:hypothetical protein
MQALRMRSEVSKRLGGIPPGLLFLAESLHAAMRWDGMKDEKRGNADRAAFRESV